MELLIYIGKAAGILALFYLVYITALQKDTLFTAKRHYLLGGILAAITFPLIEITKMISIELPVATSVVYTEMIPAEQFPVQEVIAFNWWQIALIVYALGAGFMLLRFMKQLLSLVILLYKYPSEKKDGYRYVITSENTPPFSFFRNIVYNPENHSQQELEMILKHEAVHASQWHSVDIIATNLLLIFQWPNPLAWFYKKGVEENLEFIADSATAQQIESVKQYQLALVKASSTAPIPALTNNFYQSFIKKRIVMLNKRTSKKINAWKIIIVLPLLAVFLWSFNVKEVVSYTETNEPEIILSNTFDASEVPSEEQTAANNAEREVLSTSAEASHASKNVSEENKQQKNSAISDNDIVVTITKNTTKSELDALKTELKASGVNFDYSNLQYNSANEIIGISITYKSESGNSGTYSVNSDEPITSIIIKSDGNRMSVRSAGSNSYTYSSDENEESIRVRSEEQRARMEKRRAEMEERRKEMEVHREEMGERSEQMEARRAEMELRRIEMRDRQAGMRDRQREMEKRREVIIIDGDSTNVHRIFEESEDGGLIEIHEDNDSDDLIIIDRDRARSNRERVRDHRSLFSDNTKRITKKATTTDLDQIKKELEAQGVSFSYSGLKRNDAGEITKIKLKIKDNKGTTSSSAFDGEGEAIETILIDTNNGISITKHRLH